MNEYDFKVSVSAGICVENKDGELLLVQQKRTLAWGPPAGRMRSGETPAQTAIRELEEESGVNSNELISMRLVEVRTLPRSKVKTSIGFIYHGRVRNGLVLKPNDPDGDIEKAKFYSREEIDEMANNSGCRIHHAEFSVPAMRKWLETK